MLSFGVVEAVKALGAVCQEIRDGRRYDRVTYHLERGKERTIRRFEAGEVQPRNLSEVLEGYSIAFGVPVADIFKRAAKRLEAEGTPEEFERALGSAAQASGRARGASARKRRARGS